MHRSILLLFCWEQVLNCVDVMKQLRASGIIGKHVAGILEPPAA